MCNAWNHGANCRCGWGGDGHAGVRTATGVSAGPVIRTYVAGELQRKGVGLWIVDYPRENFCRPTSCPECGCRVYFVRHNGGSVWFDSLGWPWPKHGCFDRMATRPRHIAGLDFVRCLRDAAADEPASMLCLILEGEGTATTRGRAYLVRCSDERELHILLPAFWAPTHFVGQFALIDLEGHSLTILETEQRVAWRNT
jgi:hypothetical protein